MRSAGVTMAMLGFVPGLAAAQQAPAPAPAPAQQRPAAPADDAGADEPDIIVRGTRNLPGAVIGDIPPEEQLGPADIRSYGVSSVADLLTELAPQTRSGVGGPPVVLLNGKRIAGFQEIRDIPTEAIARVDILPEEVALKYGYRADQRVVNFVLRRRFRAATVELADRIATEGGRNAPQAELDLLKIRNGGRLDLHTEYSQASALTENERNVAAQTGAGTVDQRPFRTLLPSTRNISSNLVYARPIGSVQATFNGTVEATRSQGQFGFPGATFALPAASPFATGGTAITIARVFDGSDFQPLGQRTSSLTGHLAASATGMLKTWQFYVGAAYDRVHSDTRTDVLDVSPFQTRLNALDPTADPRGVLSPASFGPADPNRGTSNSSVGGVDALLNGSLFALPAGPVSASIRLGAQTSDFTSRSYRSGLISTGKVSRDRVNGQLNVDLPIASASKGVLPWLGTLSLNGNAAVEQLSDFGTLTTLGYGANWSPITGVRVIASHADQDEAPTAQQLGNPTVVTPNVRVFDYVQGTTANVTTVTGGNPGLRADNRHVTKLGLTLKPWSSRELTFIANYVKTRVDDPIASFPATTAAIAAAFPDRFTRDANNQLLRLDTRPLNFARTERSELRYGFDFSVPIKSKLQKQIEAFRAGTGPNPFAGLRLPGGFGGRRPGEGGAPGAGQPGAAQPAGTTPGATGTPPAPGAPGQGGFRGFGGGPGGEQGGGFRGRGGYGGGGRGQGGGRLQFALYHTWHLTDRVLVAANGPQLDLLNGDAIGTGGGQSRHEIEGQAGYANNGLGARVSVNWRSATRVTGGTPTAPQQLDFGSLGTANLRLFADFGQRIDLLKKHPWLRGTRVTFGIENLFDTRQRVTDATGATPVSYQPDLLDPLGRTVRISIRKLFF